MEATSLEMLYEFVIQFFHLSNFAFFIIGILVGLAGFIILDSIFSFFLKIVDKKRSSRSSSEDE